MRLTNINITNALGCRRFDAALAKPVTLIAGQNGAGKTSIIEAVRYALTGEMPRVSLKKDAQALVTDGAKTGSIMVEWDGGKAAVALPDCKLLQGTSGDIHPAMPMVCDMHRFANLPENDRRSFLFAVTGSSTNAEDVKKRLLDRKADPAKIEAVLPLLRSGFPAANKEAAGKATEAKGAWRAITGETYGAKKAEGWTAEAPAVVADALPRFKAEVEKLNNDLEAESQALGAADQARRARMAAQERIAALQEKAAGVARITAKIAIDREERDQWQIKVDEAKRYQAGPKVHTCPDCGSALVLGEDGKLARYSREAGDDTAAEIAAELPKFEKALTLLKNAVTNGERDLVAAQAAAEQVKELEAAPPAESGDDIAARKVLIEDIKSRRDKQLVAIREIETAQRAAAEADEKTKKAAGYHADVVGWTLIADALAPDGIPGELLSQALKPINTTLAQESTDTGWNPVTIDADMQIRYGGRLRSLCSESEQWRIDAMLTVAIANLTGLGIALLDRFDVLDLPARAQALGWFDCLAENGEIESLIVAGTLKQIPARLPQGMAAYWIADGEIAGTDALKEAA